MIEIFAHAGHEHSEVAAPTQSGNSTQLLVGIGLLLLAAGIILYLAHTVTKKKRK